MASHLICLKGVQRPAASAIVCFCFCEFRAVSYSGSCAEQVADFPQGMLVFVLPLSLPQKGVSADTMWKNLILLGPKHSLTNLGSFLVSEYPQASSTLLTPAGRLHLGSLKESKTSWKCFASSMLFPLSLSSWKPLLTSFFCFYVH